MPQARFLRYYRYPHYHWAKMIGEIIKTDIAKDTTSDDATIIDAPCGDGAISYWLIRNKIGNKYELIDVSERSINIARNISMLDMTKDIELSISCKDIFDIECSHRDDIWLLVNSLYLLPDLDRLLGQMRQRSQYVIGVFPYIDRKNYRCYTRAHPERNINEMGENSTIKLFNKYGYELKTKVDTTFIAFYCIASRFSYLPSGLVQKTVRFLLSPVERVMPKRTGFYWIGVFRRA